MWSVDQEEKKKRKVLLLDMSLAGCEYALQAARIVAQNLPGSAEFLVITKLCRMLSWWLIIDPSLRSLRMSRAFYEHDQSV